MLTILIRLILIYIVLIGTMRIMGKRQIGEMQVSELVTTILLSELAAGPIADADIPLVFAVIPIGALVSIEVIISFLKPIFDGKPSILISNGRLNTEEISRVRISIEELLSQLRIAGISDIDDVNYAILEQNGQLSVIEKKSRQAVTNEDLGKKPTETGIAHAVVVDSKISDFDLGIIGKSREWLSERLTRRHANIEDVVLFTVDDSGKENLIKRK